MLNAGFQYLEQRDANDVITKDGVVGKNSPFATSDNSGIYDVIAEDLRWLKENIDDVKDTSDLEAIKQSVTDMYNAMKNDSSFGEATAKAQAEEAKKQAQAALESATNAKTYYDDITAKSTEVNNTIAEIKSYIEKAQALVESNKELEQTLGSYVTVASNKAKVASDSATNASTSETNAKTSETNAKASETNAKTSETNAAKSESDAKAHMDATATSESNAKTSETNAKTSETNSKTSETNAKTSETNAKQYSINSSNSADLSKAWAESSDSPDSVNDTDSATGKTQSSKTWAIYAKDRAISAFQSETNAKTSETHAKTSETNAADSASKAKTSETNAKNSETNAATSASNAATSEVNAKTSETNASASETDAATSETNAKSYMATAKEYMQKAQEALAAAQAIQSIVDTAKSNAEKCLADVEAVKESLAKMITYQGSVDNYSDLPTNPQVGYSYNVKNADKTHGVNAGDNLVWNGTDWDNFGSYVDMSLFAELGKDVKFNSVTAKLIGNADTASKLSTARKINITGDATGAANFDGSGDVSIDVNVSKADTANNVGNLNSKLYCSNDNGDHRKYLILYDITDWYNGHGPTGYGFNGIVTVDRYEGFSLGATTVLLTASVTWNRMDDNGSSREKTRHLRSSSDVIIPCIIKKGDMYYLALQINVSRYNFNFLGTWQGSLIWQELLCQSGETIPAGYEMVLLQDDHAADAKVIAASIADTASKLQTARNIELAGKAVGTVSFDGTEDVSINVTSVNADTAISATKTVADSAGNNIVDTYTPKTGAGASGTWPISITGNAAGLSGSLNFSDIGDVATSDKISWNGSTDGADIYYQTTASDQGNLVLNLRDDANCYLRIAYNGTFKSYFTPADGNFHGNVNGTADRTLNIPTSDVGGNIWIS